MLGKLNKKIRTSRNASITPRRKKICKIECSSTVYCEGLNNQLVDKYKKYDSHVLVVTNFNLYLENTRKEFLMVFFTKNYNSLSSNEFLIKLKRLLL